MLCAIASFYTVVATKNLPFLNSFVEIFYKKNYYKLFYLDFFHAGFATLTIIDKNFLFLGLTATSFLIYFFPKQLMQVFKIKEI